MPRRLDMRERDRNTIKKLRLEIKELKQEIERLRARIEEYCAADTERFTILQAVNEVRKRSRKRRSR